MVSAQCDGSSDTGYHATGKLCDFHLCMMKLSKQISWHCQNLAYYLFNAVVGISVIRSLLEMFDGITPLDL